MRFLVAAAAIVVTAAAIRQTAVSVSLEDHIARETTRLRAHFDAMDNALQARDVSGLTAEARAKRAKLIEWLRDYRNEGEFPLNDSFSKATVPIFRDADGTLCAMAYLIDRSGRGDIVDRIAHSRNLARIADLADDTELVEWLDEWGLSAEEAGRIQPAYGEPPVVIGPEEPDDAVDAGYALGSVALVGTSLVASYVNFTAPTRWSAPAGFIAGGATAMLGAVQLDEHGGTRDVAIVNTAVGAITMGAAIYGWYSNRGEGGGIASPIRVGSADLTIAPDIINVADRSSPGIVFRARF